MNTFLGYLLGLGYCLVSALSVIYIGHINQSINPILSELITFIIGMLFFHACNMRVLPRIYRTCLQQKKTWFLINVWTAMIWLGTFYALNEIDAVLFIALFMGLMPLITYFLAWARKIENYALKHLLFGLSVLVLMLLLIYQSLANVYYDNHLTLLLGCIYTLIGAVGGALYLLDTKNLQTQGQLSSSQILAIRFFVLIAICLIWSITNHSILQIFKLPYLNLILLALLTSILPMYCLQVSLRKIGALRFSFLMPFTPIITYFILLWIGQPLNLVTLLILVLLTVVLITYGIVKQNTHK